MEAAVKSRPRLYTDWRRRSRERNRRLGVIVAAIVLTAVALWLFGGDFRPHWPEVWP